MKKRTLSTLLLAGVMAATMVPTAVFAAAQTTKTDTTTVGYTAGGVVSPDGTVMVSVPKAVEFMDNKDVDGFDVKAFVWGYDADGNGGWQTPGTAKPDGTKYELGTGVAIDVSVASSYGYKLQRSKSDVRGAGAYTYTLDKQADGTAEALVLDGTNNGSTAGSEVNIGTLKDDAASPRYTIEGAVKMTKTPIAGQNEPATRFSDTLTYKFANLPQVTQD